MAAVEAWADGRAGRGTREVAILGELAARHPIPRDAFDGLLRGDAPGSGRRALSHRGRRRSLLLSRGRHRRRRDGRASSGRAIRTRAARRPPRSAWRCSGRTSCATSTRTSPRGRVYLARGDARALRRPCSRAPRARCCATRSPAPTRSTSSGLAGIAELRAAAAARSPPRPRMYREILRQIEREGYGARPGRAVVSASRARSWPRRARRCGCR